MTDDWMKMELNMAQQVEAELRGAIYLRDQEVAALRAIVAQFNRCFDPEDRRSIIVENFDKVWAAVDEYEAIYHAHEEGWGDFTIHPNAGILWTAFWWGETTLQEDEVWNHREETGEDLFKVHKFKSLNQAKLWCGEHLKKVKQVVTKNE